MVARRLRLFLWSLQPCFSKVGDTGYFTYLESELIWGSVVPDLAPNFDPNLNPGNKSDPQERNVEEFLMF